ncbi:hypothetical protein [Tunturiibacter gelidiferens]|uniref:Uncharacterized protein n=1 Tax=Tunturiibacter gelidiferens TaxID=3069689 RepID=A0AAU7YWC5_9BACT
MSQEEPQREKALIELPEVRTTDPKWLEKLAEFYKEHRTVLLKNDAGLPIDPTKQTLVQMGRSGKLSKTQWLGVTTSLGIGMFGAYLIVAAILDPEPTSKLGLLIASGVVLVIGGGGTSVWLLTGVKPPNVRVSIQGFEIRWQD